MLSEFLSVMVITQVFIVGIFCMKLVLKVKTHNTHSKHHTFFLRKFDLLKIFNPFSLIAFIIRELFENN